MADRQLCAVALVVFGWVAVGCGGGSAGSTNAAVDSAEKQPPTNPDQPKQSADQAANPERAPDADAAPSSADAPAGSGGGDLTALCRDFCDVVSECTGNPLAALCSRDINCQAPANAPCLSEVGDAFTCVLDNLGAVCKGAQGDGEPPQQAQGPCQKELKSFTDCAAEQPSVDDDNGNGNDTCTQADSCDCDNTCDACMCVAGSSAQARAACASLCT